MAVSSFYPANYNPYLQQMQQLQQMQTYSAQPAQGAQSNMVWVQGIEAMKSYPVAAGQTVQLMDSESNIFGIKTVDASGMPLPLRLFRYQEQTTQDAPEKHSTDRLDTSGFITRDEFEARIAEITAPKRKTRKDEENAE